jgi:hypothetical protein
MRKRFAVGNGGKQSVRGQSSNSGVSEVVKVKVKVAFSGFIWH